MLTRKFESENLWIRQKMKTYYRNLKIGWYVVSMLISPAEMSLWH